MPYRRSPATQARLDSQRDLVLGAAVEILATQGYAGCSMAAVAARAGIGTGSIYQHFPSKTELAVELFRFVVSHEVAAVTEAARQSGELVESVVAVVETFAGRALKSPRLAYALLAEPVDAAVDAERLVFRRAFRDVVAASIADGVARGVLPEQDPQLTAAALIGAVAEMLVGPLVDGAASEQIMPALVTFTLRALGGTHVRNA